MATPTGPERRFLAVGAKKGGTWGTAIALGAGNELLVTGMSGFTPQRDYDPHEEADTPFIKSGSLGDYKPVDFTLQFLMRYNLGQLGTLIALLAGTAGTPSTLVTGAYKHVLQFADSQLGLFATVVAEYPSNIYECASVKVMEWHIKLNKGLIEAELKCRGNLIITTSTVNTLTQIDALTYTGTRDAEIRYSQAMIKMNVQSGGDVATETPLPGVNSLEISYKRGGHDGLYPAGQNYIMESSEGKHPQFSIKLGFGRMDAVNGAHLATALAETTQKMLIKFTGNLIATTYYNDLALYFPRLKMKTPTPSWDAIVKNGIELEVEEAGAVPTGMTYTRPYIEMINIQATDYLA
jgi:hypothetical protein